MTELVSDLASEIQKIKQEKDITGKEGEYYPVTVLIKNDSLCVAKDIHIKLNILLTFPDATQYSIDFHWPLPNLMRGKFLEIKMFDLSGCTEGLISLLEFTYKMDGNTPLPHVRDAYSINIDDFNNAFQGYRNNEEMQTSILLRTYIRDSFSARGVLLKFTLNDLTYLNDHKGFEYGERFSFNEEQLPAIRSMIQIDIIAKIMMHIEDLILLLEAIRETKRSYYHLLDQKYKDDIDLGTRIRQFFEREFSVEDWMKMLSYIDVKNIEVGIPKQQLMKRLMESNIAVFKKLISKIKDSRIRIVRYLEDINMEASQ